MNATPNYNGILTDQQVTLILARARKLGFRRHEWPDALQEVAIELIEFEYDQKKANGGDETAILITTIDNRLCKMIRGAERDKARIDAIAPTVPQTCDFLSEELAADVREAIETLDPRDRQVAEMLAAGHSKAQIARTLGGDWHVVNRACRRIGMHFRQLGIDGWLL